jgi:pimeloyl-ACP methyl ester carboxylesterase
MVISVRDWVWKGWQIRYEYFIGSQCVPDAIPLILIHGFGSSTQQWHRNITSLGCQHPVYALDLAGFGDSQKIAASYNVSFWAQQIHDFWRLFIGRPAILVGHSLGALVAATVASEFPETVSGVVLMTLPATRQEQVSSAWMRGLVSSIERIVANPLLIRLIFNIARQRPVIRSALKTAYENKSYVTESVTDSFVKPTTDRGAAQTLCRLTQAATTVSYSKSRQSLLSVLPQPILLMWGANDRITPISQGQSLRKECSTITWEVIPDAGHCFYDECAEPVNSLILHWIETNINPSQRALS